LLALVVAQAGPPASAPVGVTKPSTARRKQLVDLLDDTGIHDADEPEYASILGDKRYNDKPSDVSEKAVLADLEVQRGS